MSRKSRYAVAALSWLVLCAVAFVLLGDAPDPSRRDDRILSNDAGRIALSLMRHRDPARFRDYEIVHVAYSPAGEAGDRARWIVLCDRVPHTALRQAIVVELDARDGHLLAIRKPVN